MHEIGGEQLAEVDHRSIQGLTLVGKCLSCVFEEAD
jgi:hypothetical protein